MPITAPTLKIPAIQYRDAGGVLQTLTFTYAPTNVVPATLAPSRSEATGGDGTLWTAYWYTAAYISMSTQVPLGPALTAWLAFVAAAVNGQVLTLIPDSGNPSYSVLARLVVGNQSSGNNAGGSNVPAGNPSPTRVSFGMYKVNLVFRFETATDASPFFSALNGI